MAPFIGHPIGFNPATLALLDAALTDIYADFQRRKVKSLAEPVATPIVREIGIARIVRRKRPAAVKARKRPAESTALRFNKARGWYLR